MKNESRKAESQQENGASDELALRQSEAEIAKYNLRTARFACGAGGAFMVDRERVEKAVAELIDAIGEDCGREGLRETPQRVARMFEELTCGYADDPAEHLSKTFAESGSGLIVERGIAFSSTCEHHLMPFFGKVHIAYVPDGKVVGLSKLARVVETYARRLQLQERMNAQIADAIYEHLAPKGVAVVVEAEHTCMTARGVKKTGSKTLSYAVRGDVPDSVLRTLLSFAEGRE